MNARARIILLLLALSAAPALKAEGETAWEDHVRAQVQESEVPVVQNRRVVKDGRFQLMGPLIGMSDRRDFLITWVASVAGRYHFTEFHGVEFLRLTWMAPKDSALAKEIRDKTSFRPDVQKSRAQLSSAYVYTPIYGKYAWSSESLVYFDIFGTAGAGLRFAEDIQPYAELGLGMNHYLWKRKLALVPEYRLRGYAERRSSTVLVLESVVQVGGSWLF